MELKAIICERANNIKQWDNPWWNWKWDIYFTITFIAIFLIILDGIESYSNICFRWKNELVKIILDGIESSMAVELGQLALKLIILDGIERLSNSSWSILSIVTLMGIILDGIESLSVSLSIYTTSKFMIILDGIERRLVLSVRRSCNWQIILDGIERFGKSKIFRKVRRDDNPWWNWKDFSTAKPWKDCWIQDNPWWNWKHWHRCPAEFWWLPG